MAAQQATLWLGPDLSVARQACGVLGKFVEALARQGTYIKFYNYVRGGHSVYFRPVCGHLSLIARAARHFGISVRGRNLQVWLGALCRHRHANTPCRCRC